MEMLRATPRVVPPWYQETRAHRNVDRSSLLANKGTTVWKILRWEAVMKNRNKVYQGGLSLWEARKKSR